MELAHTKDPSSTAKSTSKKSRMRQNNNSGEFLLVYEQRYSFNWNATDKIRATAQST
jgi:hypothetical protein